MAEAIALSTAGILVKYAVESTAGTRPSTGFTKVDGFVSIDPIGGAPDTIEVTPLAETNFKQYISVLVDTGGAIAFGVNDTDEFHTAWETLRSAYQTGKSSNKATWFEIVIPNHKSFFFAGEPNAMGFGGAERNGALTNTAYITVNKVAGFDTASTT